MVNKNIGRSTWAIVLFLVFTVCIFGPYQIYLANIDEFWFGLADFWWIPVLAGGCVAVLILFPTMFLKGRMITLYKAGFFAFAIALYIQSNFLSLDVGVLNGASIPWREYLPRMVLDAFFWVIILALCIFGAFLKKEYFDKAMYYISLLLTLMQLVALLVLLIPAILSGKTTKKDQVYASDDGLYEVGKENVIVFLVDMFDDEYFRQIMAEEPEIKENLDGFVYFSNFTGGYSTTDFSMLHLVTGQYYHNEPNPDQWIQDVTQESNYMDELVKKEFQIGLYFNAPSYFPNRIAARAVNVSEKPLKISSHLGFAKTLYQLVLYQYFPDIFKVKLWMSGTEFEQWKKVDGSKPHSSDNVVFREGLERNGLVVLDDLKCYKFIYLDGTHYPYYMNENMERVEDNAVTATQCAKGVLGIIQLYIEELKEKDVYNKTAVVVLADHGYYWDGVLTNPVFMVKPMNSNGELSINNAPTCQVDFPGTIAELAGGNENGEYGTSVFDIEEGDERERLFYQYYLGEAIEGKKRLIEYKVSGESNSRDNFVLTDVEYTIKGEKIKHSDYCKICKGIEEAVEEGYPPRLVHEKDSNYPD